MKTISFFPILIGLFFTCFPSDWLLSAQSDFEAWQKEQQQAYENFLSAEDRQYVDFLKKEWEQFAAFSGLKLDETPKPVTIPTAPNFDPSTLPPPPQPSPIPSLEPPLPAPEPIPPVSPPPPVEEPSPPLVQPEPERKIEPPLPVSEPVKQEEPITQPPIPPASPRPEDKYTVYLPVFQAGFRFERTRFQAIGLASPVDNEAIAKFWEEMSLAPSGVLIDQLRRLGEQKALNDWLYMLMTYQLASNIYPKSENEAILLTWFLLIKSGYDMRLGYNDAAVYLMTPADHNIYEVQFFSINDTRYYLLTFKPQLKEAESLFIFTGTYPSANRKLQLEYDQPPDLAPFEYKRDVSFSYDGTAYKIDLTLNQSVTDLLFRYPQTDFEVYFKGTMAQQTREKLLQQLKPLIAGKSNLEAVNILLRFVQIGFAYKTDEENFGFEKYMFPEETLYYSYSDCEDRSVLFAYLVRELLDLNVIGLDYPGHIATAVQFPQQVEGETLVYNKTRYTICDPTYLGAEVGMCMPQFKQTKPEVIQIQ